VSGKESFKVTLKKWIEKMKKDAENSGCSEFKAISEVVETADDKALCGDILQEFIDTAISLQDELNKKVSE
jgi:hypothetical protein